MDLQILTFCIPNNQEEMGAQLSDSDSFMPLKTLQEDKRDKGEWTQPRLLS